MNQIGIFNETGLEISEISTVLKLLEYAVSIEKVEDAEFNVIFVDNEKIHALNREYRHVDRPTDVISFALEDNSDFGFSDHRILGDIYISIDKAKEQSIEYGHSFLRELCFLSIHGFLHLLGYDHMEQADEEVMFARQELILNGFGIKK